MALQLEMPNGDILTVRDEASIEAAVKEWKSMIYKEHGASEEPFQMKPEEEAVREATEKWAANEENPTRRAAIGAGMANLGRNVGNMLGLTDDEELKTLQATDKALKNKHGVAYTVGEVAPTLALGAAGRALPATARLMAAAPKTAAAVEGATVGATLAGPDSRGTGAVLGGATGGLLSGLGQAAGRVGGGLAPPMREASEMAADTAAPIGAKGMETPFVPISRAADPIGPGSTVRWLYDSVLTAFPKGARKLNAQLDDAGKATMSNIVRRAYKGNADEVLRVWKETGRLDKGLMAGEALTTDNSTQAVRGLLLEAARKTKFKGTPSLAEVAKITRDSGMLGKKTVTQLRDTSELASSVLDPVVRAQGSTYTRNTVYDILRGAGKLFIVPNQIAGVMANPGFQKFLMGNTQWQTAMKAALANKNAAMAKNLLGEAARNYMAAGGDASEGGGNNGVRAAKVGAKAGGNALDATGDAVVGALRSVTR